MVKGLFVFQLLHQSIRVVLLFVGLNIGIVFPRQGCNFSLQLYFDKKGFG